MIVSFGVPAAIVNSYLLSEPGLTCGTTCASTKPDFEAEE